MLSLDFISGALRMQAYVTNSTDDTSVVSDFLSAVACYMSMQAASKTASQL